MNICHYTLLALSLAIPAVSAAQTSGNEPVVVDVVQAGDTLVSVSHAPSVSVRSRGNIVTIRVSSAGDRSDDFFYETEALHPAGRAKSEFDIYCRDVTNVSVVETPSAVNVAFVDGEQNNRQFSFEFPDPANRTSRSFFGERWDTLSFGLTKNKNYSWDLISGGFTVGMVTPTSKSPRFGSSMGGSWELGWMNILGLSYSYRIFSAKLGFGVDWRNYVTHDGLYFSKLPDGSIGLLPYEDGTADHRSRIKVFSLQVPLMLSLRMGHNSRWNVTAGGIMNFNTHASLKTEYTLGDEKYTIATSSIGQRKVTFDAYFSVSYSGIGVYARYCPMNMMKTASGLDFGSFSTGLVFFL